MPLFTLPNFLRRPRSSRPVPPERLHFHLRKRLTSANGPLELDIELDIARGESLALLGPSGSGKTSLLRLLAGLQPADGGYIAAFGRIWLDSACGIDRPPRERPARLPGGQQQRLALARALAAEPELLLLDEPLSALAGALRERQRTTLLLVTHDPGEALRLCERAVLLEAGRVAADAPPARLFGAGGPADAEQRLTLAGRVVERIAAADGSPLYRIEAEGRTCLARAAERARLEPGDSVLVSAGDWLATPLHGLR